tara:strand:- start:1102 stop:2139 length:1038 start_codon:yes stop_codon:yes gene_type:complete
MNIYSIEEIIDATNRLTEPQSVVKKEYKAEEIKLSPEVESVIAQAEQAISQKKINHLDIEMPLVLKDEVSITTYKEIDSFNYKTKIKPQIKDRIIDELYIFLKKKIKKNTLKIIIDEQIEIRNLQYEIVSLEKNKKRLKNDYQILKNNFEDGLEDYKQLKIHNGVLLDNLNLVSEDKEQLSIENNELKINLNEIKLNHEKTKTENRSLEINNAELKNVVSRYAVSTKKLQEDLNTSEKSKNLELDDETKRVKFYQDENIRLSSELLLAREKNQTIKQNLDNIETEKEKISGKIRDLSKSIEGKTNIISTPFVQETNNQSEESTDKLNNKEQKSLDEVINRIFSKI